MTCEHLSIVDWEYQEEVIVGVCEACGCGMWTWMASEAGGNAGGGHWEERE